MWTVFISLLLSITIGNSLHAMEISVDEDEDSTISVENESFNISQKRGVLEPNMLIKSLADMRQLAIKLVDGQRIPSEYRNNFPQTSEIEIPDSITIDPQVFAEYANNEDIMEEFKPGLFEKMLCCNSSRKNQFEYVRNKTPDRYKNWTKEMIFTLYYEQGEQTETMIRSKPKKLRNIDKNTVENERRIKILEEQLGKEKWKNEKLVRKTKLNQKLRSFIEKQQARENTVNERKKLVLFLLVEAACFVGGMYSVC